MNKELTESLGWASVVKHAPTVCGAQSSRLSTVKSEKESKLTNPEMSHQRILIKSRNYRNRRRSWNQITS